MMIARFFAPSVGINGGTGDRLILWPGAGGAHPYSLGMGPFAMWSSVPTGAIHAWYIGGAEMMRIATNGYLGVGVSPTNKVDIAAVARSGSHASNAPLYVTNNSNPSSAGVEFRHTNGTQGIGFGYDTIYATGSIANQNLNLQARGTGTIGLTGSCFRYIKHC